MFQRLRPSKGAHQSMENPSIRPSTAKVPSKGSRTFQVPRTRKPTASGWANTDQLANQQEIKQMAREGIEPPTRGFSVRCSTN
jgi:hypothetical protein